MHTGPCPALQAGPALGSPHPKEAKTRGSRVHSSILIRGQGLEGGRLQAPESEMLKMVEVFHHRRAPDFRPGQRELV